MISKQHFQKLKSNVPGVVILGVGLLAVLIVGILAYRTFSTPFGEDYQGSQVSEEDIDEFKNTRPQERKSVVQQEKEKSYRRQKSISERDITGNWDTRLKEGRALLQMKDGTYRLIMVNDNPASARLFSNGTYKMQDDLVMFYPNMDWGPPKSRKYGYRVLTRSSFPVLVSKYKGKLVWQLPGRDVDVYVPNIHPLLSSTPNDLAVWSVLK